MEKTILSTKHLCRSFGALKAVNDINLDIPDKKVWAIIGSNGAGKSTLLNLITNGTPPTSGQVFYYGEDITCMPTYDIVNKGISKCFQISKLFTHLSVYDNVQIACICHRKKKFRFFDNADGYLDEDVRHILDVVKLTEKKDEIAGFLSYGDQRKLEIGLALALEPTLLLLDEPTAGISRTEGYELMRLVTDICKDQGITIIFIEHDMEIVFDFAEQITVMHRGEHLITDIPEKVRKDPQVIATYLGGM